MIAWPAGRGDGDPGVAPGGRYPTMGCHTAWGSAAKPAHPPLVAPSASAARDGPPERDAAHASRLHLSLARPGTDAGMGQPRRVLCAAARHTADVTSPAGSPPAWWRRPRRDALQAPGLHSRCPKRLAVEGAAEGSGRDGRRCGGMVRRRGAGREGRPRTSHAPSGTPAVIRMTKCPTSDVGVRSAAPRCRRCTTKVHELAPMKAGHALPVAPRSGQAVSEARGPPGSLRPH
jgi:hypothetical protein